MDDAAVRDRVARMETLLVELEGIAEPGARELAVEDAIHRTAPEIERIEADEDAVPAAESGGR